MERIFNNKQKEHFDLIIIGGGITGVCLAYEASTRGLSVALFEKDDFGQATSAATSKLIHGGLRYLKNLEFGLVRESLNERRVWENIAPNLVYPIPFMVPTYRSIKSNRFVLAMGMILYDLLSFDKGFTWDRTKKLPLHKSVNRKNTLELENCVKTHGLTGSSIYYDCQNANPERLTLAVLRSAMKHGAQAANYALVDSFIKNGDTIQGVRVVDKLSGQIHRFTSTVTVNCAGPWADLVLKSATSGNIGKHQIRRSEGIHIITEKLCNKHAVTVMTRSGRHIMLMPWRNHSLIGTTDKEYFGNPDQYKVSQESINELIDELNENFGCKTIKPEDVKFAYGGLRPLVDTQTENSYETSRKYEIYDNSKQGINNLITIEGGKYTTSRKLACNAMKLIAKKMGREPGNSVTDKQHLQGCDISNMEEFRMELRKQYPDFTSQTIDYITTNYGTLAHRVLQMALKNQKLQQQVSPDGEILAEVVYAIEKEMACSLTDILFRRTGIGTLGYPGDEIFFLVAQTTAETFEWDEQRLQDEIQKAMQVFNLTKAISRTNAEAEYNTPLPNFHPNK